MALLRLGGKYGSDMGNWAIVDDDLFEELNKIKWHVLYDPKNNRYRPTGRVDKRSVLLHRYVLGVTNPKIEVDHINGDTLDAQQHNLRTCTHRQNMANQKKPKHGKLPYKGIIKHKNYHAYVRSKGKSYHMGAYNTPEEAAKAYDIKALELFGEFAKLNFPNDISNKEYPKQINNSNTGHKNIYYHKQHKKYLIKIRKNGKITTKYTETLDQAINELKEWRLNNAS